MVKVIGMKQECKLPHEKFGLHAVYDRKRKNLTQFQLK